MREDLFGNEIWVGDTVAFVFARFRNLQRGTVTSYRGAGVMVLPENSKTEIIKLPEHLVKFVHESNYRKVL
jgi:hypothetical protein